MTFKVKVPFTGQTIDFSDPTDAVLKFGLMTAGFGVLFFAQDLGADAKTWLGSFLGLGSDADSGPDVL